MTPDERASADIGEAVLSAFAIGAQVPVRMLRPNAGTAHILKSLFNHQRRPRPSRGWARHVRQMKGQQP